MSKGEIVESAGKKCPYCAGGDPLANIEGKYFHGTWAGGCFEYDTPCLAQEEQQQLAELTAE
ncbi:MAG: hypothetical protein WCG48_00095 [Candidatus Berkelbacteria bacterium]